MPPPSRRPLGTRCEGRPPSPSDEGSLGTQNHALLLGHGSATSAGVPEPARRAHARIAHHVQCLPAGTLHAIAPAHGPCTSPRPHTDAAKPRTHDLARDSHRGMRSAGARLSRHGPHCTHKTQACPPPRPPRLCLHARSTPGRAPSPPWGPRPWERAVIAADPQPGDGGRHPARRGSAREEVDAGWASVSEGPEGHRRGRGPSPPTPLPQRCPQTQTAVGCATTVARRTELATCGTAPRRAASMPAPLAKLVSPGVAISC